MSQGGNEVHELDPIQLRLECQKRGFPLEQSMGLGGRGGLATGRNWDEFQKPSSITELYG